MRTSTTVTLAELVRQFRSEARLSQEDLAERAGLSPRTVSKIETGAAPTPRAVTLSLLTEALGLDVEKRQRLFDVSRTPKAAPSDVPAERWAELLESFGRDVCLNPGDRLFAKGQAGDALYVIASGSVRLLESGVDLGSGAFVGEIAVFSPEAKRTQSAVATSETRLIEVSRTELPALNRRFPELGAHLLRLITGRLLANNVEPRTAPTASADR